MKLDIKHKKKQISSSYDNDILDVAYDFSKKAYKEFSDYIKEIVLFGSTARKKHGTKGDIDILIILNDVSLVLDKQFIQAYRVILEKIVADTNPKKLHITTLKLTSFWEYIRAGDPVAINILRDGVPIVDTGFFEPLQALLFQGRIRPTSESMWSYFNKAPVTLSNAKWHVKQGCLDLYWAVIDSAHAALMKLNEVPASPNHVADMLDQKMVSKNLLDKKYVEIMREFYHLSKGILHEEIKEVSGSQFDQYCKQADDFVNTMRRFIEEE